MVAADQSGQHQGRVNPTWILSSATHVLSGELIDIGVEQGRIVALEHALASEAEVYDAKGSSPVLG
jgi:formylmethanofuran dehydrogenase subunit A